MGFCQKMPKGEIVSVFWCWHVFWQNQVFSDRCSSLVFQHRLYLASIFLASKWSWIWYGWDDLHDLITYALNILCMESAFSSMTNRRWIWTWFWLKGKSFTWCLTRCYNTLYIFGKCGSAWLIRFDLRELELIAWAVIFILWLFYVWYVDSRH